MSSQLTVTQTIELLDSLKSTVRDFAGAEEKLNREQRTRSEAAQKRLAEDLAAEAAALAGQLSATEAAAQREKELWQHRAESRRTRIQSAHKASKKALLERIDNEEGRVKYQSQKGQLDTKRWRTEALAANDASFAEFSARLTENRNQFVELESGALAAFRGYGKFLKLLENSPGLPESGEAADEQALLEKLTGLHGRAQTDLSAFTRLGLPKLFRAIPLWLWVALILVLAGAAAPALQKLGHPEFTFVHAGIGGGFLLVVVLGLYFAGAGRAAALASMVANQLETARRWHNSALEKATARHAGEAQRIETEAEQRTDGFNANWREALHRAEEMREVWPGRIDQKAVHAQQRHAQLFDGRLARLEARHAVDRDRLHAGSAARTRELTAAHQAKVTKFTADYEAHWQKLAEDWQKAVQPLWKAIQELQAGAMREFPEWQAGSWDGWATPREFKNAAPFGRLELELKRFAEALPQDSRLAWPGPAQLSLPLVLQYPQQGSILFETTKTGNEPVFAALNNLIFRLLAGTPAGKASFTIIDPVKLGQNFSAVMHLADYEDNAIGSRISTQPNQIDERLAELNEHMEKVIQMYLRNEYETIVEYNRQAGNIAEKYHFVVVADFPANFTESAVKRLLRIAASGARCGVYTLIHWDHRHTAPADFFPEELRKSSVCLNAAGEQFVLAHPMVPRAAVRLEMPPPGELATSFLHKVGQASRGSNRVEVPFAQIAPAAKDTWSLETTEELRVPIGRSGATKLQYLAIGKGTRQHALIAGKTGSGKSTLFHVMITNLALWCSPEQVEFYLVDFKKGVEFKSYAAHRLPHARVVAIESDREFGLSVLQKLDDELKRRGELFRKLGVQDVAGFKKAGGAEPMPRTLLLIDEFQEFFVEDDRISQAANLLLDRIVRQGRAFGIHCLLGSQTLGGAYTLARTTIGQMVIRIALQCNEADAYLIMDENNPAPRLLTRPGEGIYNDMAGMSEGNSPFQAVWIGDDERDVCLDKVRARADASGANHPGPIVFEGNAPADLRENPILRQLLATTPGARPSSARMWLGAPNSIKGPTEAVFQKRSGSNLLIVGQRDEAVLAMLASGLLSLSAQFPSGSARFVVFESTPPESPERTFVERAVAAVPHPIRLAKPGELAEVLNGLAEELQRRTSEEPAAAEEIFLVVHGLQNFKKLKQDDDFGFSSDDSGPAPSAQLQKLVAEGPAHGMHVIASLDTYNNVNRFLGRKQLSEFEMRVLFQMSTNDSASLCDDPKASNLGLHRALFYNEQEGWLETFRPYALPPGEWIDETGGKLRALLPS